jgi:hypothetical protein
MLRVIARDVLDRAFPEGLPPEADRELITSITRQLLTYNGHAGVVTGKGNFWVSVVDKPDDAVEVGMSHVPEVTVLRIVKSWDIDADLVPEILHRLTVAQSAEVTSRKGVRLRLWIEPAKRMTHVKRVAVEEGP